MAENAEALTYRDAGVDRDAASRAKDRIARLVESTRTAGVLSSAGSFGGVFEAPGAPRRALVASADGVGTKLQVAIRANRHDTVGRDLVNHCADDILVEGARPLFFLDYIATGVLDEGVVEDVVAGVAEGCRENGCALLGGETAEMPDFYAPGDYDLAGFIVGEVDVEGRPGPGRVRAGDALIGLASEGFHTNGYSLLRRLLFARLGLGVDDPFPGLDESVADVLLRVHRSYVGAVTPVLDRCHALAHITGGGILENLDRALPPDLDARVRRGSWQVPAEFTTVVRAAGLDDDEAFRTFNMGVGMVLVVAEPAAEGVMEALRTAGEDAWVLGDVGQGEGRVRLV
ncbi:MAG TPA: phosphoribosylformylglycinamidine cyclo-ligase [Longimicrobiales bacterium]|nr:phosphoribosylformylglycinamidine cyclo-ligase [Longimicrobiales bacterium]